MQLTILFGVRAETHEPDLDGTQTADTTYQ
jgi:hypothetical protein